MNWFSKLVPSKIRTVGGNKRTVPEGLWIKCDGCSAVLYRSELERNFDVCPKCSHHMRIGARLRLEMFLDDESGKEIGQDIEPVDVLKFRDSKKYRDRLNAAQKATGEKDALVAMRGTLRGLPVIVLAAELSLKEKCPLICFSASGGARMQEALFSLMQMAKTSAALARLSEAGIPYISVLTDPTMGGVSASFAMLGDINIAEPKALIGFAGPRVIEQTVRETLPEGFQRSEFLLEHGAVDMIIARPEMRERIARLLAMLTGQTLPTG